MGTIDNPSSESKAGRNGKPITLRELAAHKALSASYLKRQGLLDLPDGSGIGIPYFDTTGKQIALKRRTRLVAKEGSWWPKGMPLRAYGEWRLDEARKERLLFAVEGESDCWALWLHGLPALGIPGANSAKVVTAEHLECLDALYLVREPGQGGEAFITGMTRRLAELGFQGKAFELHCPAGLKDPADVHAQAPERFLALMEQASEEARPLDITPPRKQSPGSSSQPEAVPVMSTFSDIQPRPVEWLWRPWIPLGALTLLDGDPGLGKSTIAVDLAARVSVGWAMPPDYGNATDPADVLILSAEDDPHTTIRPRLDAAGADVSRVHILTAMRVGEAEHPPVLPYDLTAVEGMILDKGIKLTIVDPLMAYLDSDIDSHRDQDVRRCLHQLKLLAERTLSALLIIRHLNKLLAGPALYRGGGSIGIIGAVRAALIVGRNPADPTQSVLAPVKCNLARMPPALLYGHEPVGPDVSRIGWVGETDLTADDILIHPGGSKQSAGDQCTEAVRRLLPPGSRMESAELEERCKQMGFSERAVKHARRALEVRAFKDSSTGNWFVEMPLKGDSGEEASQG
jgi:hypothetical protein